MHVHVYRGSSVRREAGVEHILIWMCAGRHRLSTTELGMYGTLNSPQNKNETTQTKQECQEWTKNIRFFTVQKAEYVQWGEVGWAQWRVIPFVGNLADDAVSPRRVFWVCVVSHKPRQRRPTRAWIPSDIAGMDWAIGFVLQITGVLVCTSRTYSDTWLDFAWAALSLHW